MMLLTEGVDWGTLGKIAGGLMLSVYTSIRLKKAWPNRLNGSRQEILSRLAELEGLRTMDDARIMKLENRLATQQGTLNALMKAIPVRRRGLYYEPPAEPADATED